MSGVVQLSEPYRRQIRRAARILRESGYTEVFLFGSLAAGEIKDKSDIDLAVRGCPKGEFFHTFFRTAELITYSPTQTTAHAAPNPLM